MKVGTALRRLRKQRVDGKPLTLTEVARRACLPKQRVAKLELNQITTFHTVLADYKALAAALGYELTVEIREEALPGSRRPRSQAGVAVATV